MSLLRLLTAGKSLVGSKSAESRYHLSRPGALPRFGGKKNPFRATSRPEAAQSAATAPGREEPQPAEPASPSPLPATPVEVEFPPEAAVVAGANGAHGADRAEAATVGPRAASATATGIGGSALAQCAGKLKSFFQMRRQKTPAPAVPRFSKPLIQGELSLERVRVVRNDLSDSDVEIVPARAPATPTLERTADGSWEKVTGRLFGAGKV